LQEAITKPFRALAGERRKKIGDRQTPLSPNSYLLSTPDKEEFWALKDVSFEVKRGEVVGIIGRNGAGKSTLLKILSRITEPSEGRVTLRGRVASLLEVGTGFHPELTGRENIFLNGAILGMSKAEIRKKFDEIVAFAEVERFLDTPVKRYSSGMYVRLAFAVAAHLEPEILVVDEVLAVGDAEFQKKCLGKMKDVATGGRTVLFVSHNMGAVASLCEKVIYLKNGKVSSLGKTPEQIYIYLKDVKPGSYKASGPLHKIVKIKSIEIQKKNNQEKKLKPEIHIKVHYELKETVKCFRPFLGLSTMGIRICSWEGKPSNQDVEKGHFLAFYKISSEYLKNGIYSVSLGGISKEKETWLWAEDAEAFEIYEHELNDPNQIRDGVVYLP
jgi:lipopolysaccharide transport system ATP-binding protein